MDYISQELKKLEDCGQLRKIPDITSKYSNKVIIDGKEYVNFASNDYLGISTETGLEDEFLSSHKPLLSSASARLLSGTSSEFSELENTLAKLSKKEKALVFNTGYQCNLGVISALCSKGDVVFSDKLNHASIIDGMRLSDGDFFRYKHLDYDNLENMLKTKRSSYKRAIIVSESVFSMDGDIADLARLKMLKEKYDCLLMIDEAHAFFAAGDNPLGISSSEADIVTATFGKALGSFGAFCVSSENIINYLINKARSFIFSTSIPPINISWTNWLLTEKYDYLISKKAVLNKITREAHAYLNTKGLTTPSQSHIIPVITGTNENTLKISEKLKSLGYYIPAIRPPTVPEGTSRLRISLTANSSVDDFKRIIDEI